MGSLRRGDDRRPGWAGTALSATHGASSWSPRLKPYRSSSAEEDRLTVQMSEAYDWG